MPSGIQQGSAAKAGPAGLPPLVAERLLGALELTVAALDLPVPPLVHALPEAARQSGKLGMVVVGNQSEMVTDTPSCPGTLFSDSGRQLTGMTVMARLEGYC